MATTKTENKEGKQNEAEAAATLGAEPAAKDVSVAPNTGTSAEKVEGKQNEAEAGRAKEKRAAEEKDTPETVYPASHNGQNRRISDMLREARGKIDVNALLGANRKLKAEAARLKNESSNAETGQPPI